MVAAWGPSSSLQVYRFPARAHPSRRVLRVEGQVFGLRHHPSHDVAAGRHRRLRACENGDAWAMAGEGKKGPLRAKRRFTENTGFPLRKPLECAQIDETSAQKSPQHWPESPPRSFPGFCQPSEFQNQDWLLTQGKWLTSYNRTCQRLDAHIPTISAWCFCHAVPGFVRHAAKRDTRVARGGLDCLPFKMN